MESTRLIEALGKIRANYSEPVSHMEAIRRTLNEHVENADRPKTPDIFNPDQRKVFTDQIDQISAFLATEDGADAVELLVKSFQEFVTTNEPSATSPEPKPPDGTD